MRLFVPSGRVDRSLAVVGALLVAATAGVFAFSLGGSSGAGAAAAPSAGSSSRPTNAVVIKDFKFGPPAITVRAGSTISFRNTDNAAHTVTSAQGAVFDTGGFEQGQTKTVTIARPGTYAYVCAFHPFMKGVITVKAA